jgi:major intracellular serine protease
MRVCLPVHRTRNILAKNIARFNDWSYEYYSIADMHKAGLRGEGVRIAILDTGTNTSHPALWGKLYDGVDLTDEGVGIEDLNGHGTWIHGRISAVHNDYGPRGFAPDAEVVVIKVLDKNGAGDLDNIAKGVKMAVAMNCNMINLSIGVGFRHPGLGAAIKKAVDKNVIVAAASGNDYSRNPIDFPGSMIETICVGSHDRRGRVSKFSDTGHEMDVFSAGEDVLSTDLGDMYSYKDGTSMSTPTFLSMLACLKSSYISRAEVFEVFKDVPKYLSRLS